jgi:hypothetical protein
MIPKEQAQRKNSQPAAGRRVPLKMGRRLSGGRRICYVSIQIALPWIYDDVSFATLRLFCQKS